MMKPKLIRYKGKRYVLINNKRFRIISDDSDNTILKKLDRIVEILEKKHLTKPRRKSTKKKQQKGFEPVNSGTTEEKAKKEKDTFNFLKYSLLEAPGLLQDDRLKKNLLTYDKLGDKGVKQYQGLLEYDQKIQDKKEEVLKIYDEVDKLKENERNLKEEIDKKEARIKLVTEQHGATSNRKIQLDNEIDQLYLQRERNISEIDKQNERIQDLEKNIRLKEDEFAQKQQQFNELLKLNQKQAEENQQQAEQHKKQLEKAQHEKDLVLMDKRVQEANLEKFVEHSKKQKEILIKKQEDLIRQTLENTTIQEIGKMMKELYPDLKNPYDGEYYKYGSVDPNTGHGFKKTNLVKICMSQPNFREKYLEYDEKKNPKKEEEKLPVTPEIVHAKEENKPIIISPEFQAYLPYHALKEGLFDLVDSPQPTTPTKKINFDDVGSSKQLDPKTPRQIKFEKIIAKKPNINIKWNKKFDNLSAEEYDKQIQKMLSVFNDLTDKDLDEIYDSPKKKDVNVKKTPPVVEKPPAKPAVKPPAKPAVKPPAKPAVKPEAKPPTKLKKVEKGKEKEKVVEKVEVIESPPPKEKSQRQIDYETIADALKFSDAHRIYDPEYDTIDEEKYNDHLAYIMGAYPQPQQGHGKNPPLYNNQIDDMMRKVKGFKGVFAIDQLNQIPITGKEKEFSFIMNTVPISIPTGHWVAVRIEPDVLEYYDSFGEDPSKQFLKNIRPVLKKYGPNNIYQFKINHVKFQRNNSNNCGWFAQKFLYDRSKGKTFKDATGFKILEHSIAGEKDVNLIIVYANFLDH